MNTRGHGVGPRIQNRTGTIDCDSGHYHSERQNKKVLTLPLARGLRSHPQPALGGSMDKSLGGSRAPTSGGRAAWDGLPGGGSLGKWRDSPTAPMSAGNVNFQFEYECEFLYEKNEFLGTHFIPCEKILQIGQTNKHTKIYK